MLNQQGYVAECTGDNIFIVHHNRIITPPSEAGSLVGITQSVVIELAEEMGLQVLRNNLTRYDLYTADECFLTGTAAEVIPVRMIDKRMIGPGRPGAITNKLRDAFHHRVHSHAK